MEVSIPILLKSEKRSFTPDLKTEYSCQTSIDKCTIPSSLSPLKKRNIEIDFSGDNMQIDKFELFLNNNKESNITSKLLSIIDLNNGKKKYDELKEINGPYYVVFGYQAHGFIFYTLYKSKSNKIYVIKLTLKAIHSYVEIKNSLWFNN